VQWHFTPAECVPRGIAHPNASTQANTIVLHVEQWVMPVETETALSCGKKCDEMDARVEENQMPYFPMLEIWMQVKDAPKVIYRTYSHRPVLAPRVE